MANQLPTNTPFDEKSTVLSPQQTPKKVISLMTSFDEQEDHGDDAPQSPKAKPKRRVGTTSNKTVLDKLFIAPRSIEFEDESAGKGRMLKSLLFTALNPRSRQRSAVLCKWFISNVILVDFVFFVISTEPRFRNERSNVFRYAEGVTSTIFLLEYLARVYTITESHKYLDLGPLLGRLRYAVTFGAVLDLLSTLPFFVELFFSNLDLPQLSYVRIFRLARILKANGFVQAVDAVWRVLYYNRQIMYMSLFVGLFMILSTSILMYYLRPRGDLRSDQFESILSTMYLSTLMLTGQGGPEGDLPWYTKGVVLLTGAFSIGMFAIPVSMLTWGFEAEAERCAKRARQLEKRRASRNPGDASVGYSTEEYSTDEEYQKIIAGEDSDSDDDGTKEAMKIFLQADKDGSGTISLKEYLELSRLNRRGSSSSIRQSQNDGDLANRVADLERKVDVIAEQMNRLCDELLTPKSIRWKEDLVAVVAPQVASSGDDS